MDHRNSYGVLPEYTVFMLEGEEPYCDHCLAFPRKSRKNKVFEIIHGDEFNYPARHPDIQFYTTDQILPEKTIQTVAGIIEQLEQPEICIECIGSRLLVAIPQIPDRRRAAAILDFL